MKFTIDRFKLACGLNYKEKGKAQLLNEKGNMCIIGQCLLQIGVKPNDILERYFLHSILEKYEDILTLNKFIENDKSTHLTRKAMTINDSYFDNDEREKALTELFNEYGYELNFVGKYNENLN